MKSNGCFRDDDDDMSLSTYMRILCEIMLDPVNKLKPSTDVAVSDGVKTYYFRLEFYTVFCIKHTVLRKHTRYNSKDGDVIWTFVLSICSLLSINVTKSFYLLLFVDTTCFGLTRPSSSVIVHFTEPGALLCHFSLCQGAS
jgi:hypothetical protein